MARAGVAAAKAVAVRAEKVALLGRNAGAFAVADVRAGLQRGLLAGQRQGQGLFHGRVPGVEQVEAAKIGRASCRERV